MENVGKYDYFMRVIDRWTDETTDTKGIPFKHLREGALVKEIVVSPGYSISVARLKTYFATNILEIYPWNASANVTWRDIFRSLTENGGKKYDFNFEELEKCFSPEQNREAARRTQLIADNDELTENVEVWEDIPVYLLEKLQEKFRKKLGEYWYMCDVDIDESKHRTSQPAKWKARKARGPQDEKANECNKMDEQKLNKYMECLMALALHEIFVRRMIESWNMMIGEYEQRNEMLDKILREMEETAELYKEVDEKEKKKLEEQIKNQTQEGMENMKWVKKFWILQLLCLEHNISLGAEIQIVMLLEKKRLEEIKEDKGEQECKVEDFLKFMEGRYLTSVEIYNRNKKKHYRQLEADVQDVFVNYLNSIPWSARRDITGAIETYLGIVEKGKLNYEQRNKLWFAQSIIACPLMDTEESTGSMK